MLINNRGNTGMMELLLQIFIGTGALYWIVNWWHNAHPVYSNLEVLDVINWDNGTEQGTSYVLWANSDTTFTIEPRTGMSFTETAVITRV